MGIPAYVYGFVTKDYHTETAATPIEEDIEAIDGARLALIDLNYLCGTTAHLACFMFANDAAGHAGSSRNTASVLALSGQKNITCAVAPKSPAGDAAAAADVIAFQLTDGTWEWDTVASVAGSVITCTNNITGVDAGAGGVAIAAGGKVLILGIVGDLSYQALSLPLSVASRYGEGDIVLVHPHVGEPWHFYDGNATAAGFLYGLTCAHINK